MRNSLSPALSAVVRNLALALLAAAAAVAVFALVPFPSSGAAGERLLPQSELTLPDGTRAVEELQGQRTASSRTYRLEDGRRLTKLFANAVNYRDGGKWEPIDTSLVSTADGDVEPAAAGFDLSLPRRSDGHVRVADGAAWLEFGLQGAGSKAPSVEGSTARYSDVVNGVDLEYRALGHGLKESLVLADRSAPARFAFDLTMASGLRPVERRSGAIDMVGADGKAALSIAAPHMRDAAGELSRAVDYRLERSGGGWRLAVQADEAWLDASARRYPVEVDPTVYIGATADCTLDASTPTTSQCGDDELEIGWNGSHDHRGALKFDVDSVVPKGGYVEYAYLAMYMRSKTGSANKDVGIYRMTRDWTSAASWNRYDGTNSWTTAGGDFDSTLWRKSQLGSASPGQYYYFGISELVQKWRDGAFPNYGLAVKDVQDTTTNNLLRFGSTERPGTGEDPYVGITWDVRLGDLRQFTLDRQTLGDRSQLAVNVANGNLMYSANDVQIAGTGLDLSIARHFNNLGDQYHAATGHGWELSAGGGIYLWPGAGGDRVLWGPTGSRQVFHLQTNGTFTSPTGIDAKLTTEGSGWKLHFEKTAVDWHFNSDGDLTSQEDRNGNEISYSYSAPGELDEITDTQGRTLETHYASGKLDALEDSTGRIWDYGYDSYGHLTSYTDPDGETTDYEYQGPEDLVRITDPRGIVTKLEYDSSSRITAIKRNYDDATNTWTARTSYAYSGPTSPCSSTTDVAKTVVTDPRGHDTTYCADLEARITKVVDANGNTRSSTYTPNSDPDTTTAPGSATTTRAYTSNNLTSVTQPAGEVTTMTYTNSSFPRFLSQVTGPQGTITKLDYNAQGNLSTVNDGQTPTPGVEAKLEYNGQTGGVCPNDATTHPGTLRCAIDGKGNQTLYGYDDYGNLTSITPEAPLGDTTITYDALSRIDTVEDGKGQTRSFTYDPLDRVTQIEYSNGETIDYEYDENGNLLNRDDSVHGLSFYEYDELNRRLNDDLPSGDTDYTWDAASNLASLTDAGGTVTYGYDDANRLTSLAEPGGSCTSPVSLCTTFGYTNRDQRSSTVYPNGVTQSVTYDASDKPANITAVKAGTPSTTLTNFTYDYNHPSPSTAKSDLLQWVTDKDSNKTTFTYDALGRLTDAVEKNSGGTTIDLREYDYDKASNLITRTFNSAVVSYAYNDANQLCWYKGGGSTNACGSPPSGSETFTYDANGNMTGASNGLDFDYNIRDQTTAWTPPGGTTATFGYAGPNQVERTAIGGAAQHNTMLGLSRQGTTEWTRDPDGTLVSQNAGGTRHYYLADRLGSIVGLTSSTGTLAQSYNYDPYGLTKSSSGSVSNPFQFTAQHIHFSPTHGLYKMGARYYWQGDGRWFQQDPIDQPDDLRNGNRYVYAAADPINLTDPTGTIPVGQGASCWRLDSEAERRECVMDAVTGETLSQGEKDCLVGAGIGVATAVGGAIGTATARAIAQAAGAGGVGGCIAAIVGG